MAHFKEGRSDAEGDTELRILIEHFHTRFAAIQTKLQTQLACVRTDRDTLAIKLQQAQAAAVAPPRSSSTVAANKSVWPELGHDNSEMNGSHGLSGDDVGHGVLAVQESNDGTFPKTSRWRSASVAQIDVAQSFLVGRDDNEVSIEKEIIGKPQCRSDDEEFTSNRGSNGKSQVFHTGSLGDTVTDRVSLWSTGMASHEGSERNPVGRFSTSVRRGNKKRPQPLQLLDADLMRQKAREAVCKADYDVANYYKTEGLAQFIARNSIFEGATLLVIILNAIWMSIDADNNNAAVLSGAPVFIQVGENLFCIYFLCRMAHSISCF
jgi:hypothetical protein